MKNALFPSVAALALLSLAACNHKPEVVDGNAPDPMAAELANAAPVELPPAMTDSVTFRCKDNSLLYVDFFKGDKQVNLRTVKNGPLTTLKAPEAGQPYTADGGYKLTGDPKKVTVDLPGGKTDLVCHV